MEEDRRDDEGYDDDRSRPPRSLQIFRSESVLGAYWIPHEALLGPS